jgi:S1-C subfamily serine protease
LTAPVTTPPEPADVVVTQPEWPSIIASVEPAVVKIQTEDQTACGVIIDTGGYIITHSSVIIPDKSITITLQHERQYSGEIAGQDEKLNLTIVKVTSDNTTLPVAVLGDSEGLKPRDKVAVIGYAPDKLDLNEDVIGTVVTIVDETKSIYTDIPFTDKILGAALINDKGEVIGIVAGRISTNEVKDSAFAIAINEARPLIEQATGKQ